MARPSLDDITEHVCPEGTYHKCLPYGDCYGPQEYCSSRNKAVNSCFPHNIADDQDALLSWCRRQAAGNAALIADPACKHACDDRFNVTTLYQSLYQSPQSHNEDSSGYTWAILGLAICLAIFLAVSVTLNVVLFFRLRRTQRRQIPTVEDAWTQDDSNHTAGNNKQGNVNDKIEEPAATPPVDILETDRTLNQPPLDETNLPSSFLVDRVQGRSTNTQSDAPINQGDTVEGRSTNTQNGTQIDQKDQTQGRRANIQNRVPIDQPHSAQVTRVIMENVQVRSPNIDNEAATDPLHNLNGRGANIQNDAATIQFVSVQGGTRHTQHGEVRYLPQHTASLASTSLRRPNDGTPEELAELIPRNHTTESDETISLGPAPTDQSIHANPTIPEAAGRPPDGTHVRNLD
ncbi:hypothetical protein BsWGS_06861 [Bradybaena similaris]